MRYLPRELERQITAVATRFPAAILDEIQHVPEAFNNAKPWARQRANSHPLPAHPTAQ